MRRPAALAGVVSVALLAGVLSAPSHAAPPGQLTLQFGRTQMEVVTGCDPAKGRMPDTLSIGDIADELAARGVSGVGTVVADQTHDVTRFCDGGTSKPTWVDLLLLQARGWEFVSSGATYTPLTKLPPDRWWAESCGSLETFAAHGIDASAEFAYPGNKWVTEAQEQVVSSCFSYGRQYVGTQGGYLTTSQSPIVAPWWAKVASLNGGYCADPALSCGTARFRYDDPSKLAATMQVRPGRWATVQAYVLVDGVRPGEWGWDCTGAGDPATWTGRWTYQPEFYCAGDYFWALDRALEAGVQVTTPAAVAAAWGR